MSSSKQGMGGGGNSDQVLLNNTDYLEWRILSNNCAKLRPLKHENGSEQSQWWAEGTVLALLVGPKNS